MSRPRTVLYVQHYPDGGSITGLLDLVRGLDPARYRPVVAFRLPNQFVGEFESAGIECVVMDPAPVPVSAPAEPTADRASEGAAPPPKRSSSVLRELRRLIRRDLPRARRYRRLVREHGVEVVHANNDVLSNRDAVIAAISMRRPLVVHVRWLHTYEADWSRRIDRLLARGVQRVIYMSRAIERGYSDLRIPAGRELVLDDPFDTSVYDVEPPAGLDVELGLDPDAPVVLHIGRIIEWKGQDVFLRAMAQVVQAHPDAVALVVGTSTNAAGDRFQAELDQLVDDLGIGDNVVMAGPRRDIPELIARASVVVHSSTTPEPFGRVVVEAMAGARAVVGSDAGGVPEIIDDGRTGVLATPGDAGELGDAVGTLLSDPAAAEAMGQRARAAVQDRFSVERHDEVVQGLYDELLD